MTPLISVILPSYNHVNHVSQAIECVLNQTYTDFELLISDDCSTDGTADMIKKYKDDRIKVNFFTENQGAAINHKYLIDRSKGKYIALINSDDIWTLDRLEKQVKFLQENEEYGACFSWSKFVDENNNSIMEDCDIFNQPNRTQGQWLAHFYTHGNCICHPSMLIKSEVYKTIGIYNLGLRQLPDFDMWIRLVKNYKIHIIQEPLVLHRRFINIGENTSSPSISNSMRDVMESYNILTRFFDDVNDDIFIDGFKKYFRNKNAATSTELMCERFFLILDKKYYMPQIEAMAAINFFVEKCNSEDILNVFKKEYNFTIKDFYDISCKVDLLGMMPPNMSMEGNEDFNIDTYVKYNKIKVLSTMFFSNKNSKFYRSLKSIYQKNK